jgi:hypothetical protein
MNTAIPRNEGREEQASFRAIYPMARRAAEVRSAAAVTAAAATQIDHRPATSGARCG